MKFEVVAQLRKRLMTSVPAASTSSGERAEGAEVAIYLGDVQGTSRLSPSGSI